MGKSATPPLPQHGLGPWSGTDAAWSQMRAPTFVVGRAGQGDGGSGAADHGGWGVDLHHDRHPVAQLPSSPQGGGLLICRAPTAAGAVVARRQGSLQLDLLGGPFEYKLCTARGRRCCTEHPGHTGQTVRDTTMPGSTQARQADTGRAGRAGRRAGRDRQMRWTGRDRQRQAETGRDRQHAVGQRRRRRTARPLGLILGA